MSDDLEYRTPDGKVHRIPLDGPTVTLYHDPVSEPVAHTGSFSRPFVDMVAFTVLSLCTIVNSIAIILVALSR